MSRVFPAARPVTGPTAAVMKYDILSAIGLIGIHGSNRDQVSMPRLALLVTARYNWRRNEVSMGQAEMARLWGVSDRTAKREVKFWVEQKLLICVRAGVRGRVASYRLNLSRIIEMSEPFWAAIGSDFSKRMAAEEIPEPQDQKVVPLRVRHAVPSEPDISDPWSAVKRSLNASHPEVYSSWLADLDYDWSGPGTVHVTAPSRFIASYVDGHYMDVIEAALRLEVPDFRQVSISTS
ncbi:DnaA N-terminal domain-containing protein [Marivita sp. S0852]|uniref:DnaA N-terminal domain-containing protein n=1 Tax=Marivita sp. S0852 TaxID=3373893 RepID=UPI003982276C